MKILLVFLLLPAISSCSTSFRTYMQELTDEFAVWERLPSNPREMDSLLHRQSTFERKVLSKYYAKEYSPNDLKAMTEIFRQSNELSKARLPFKGFELQPDSGRTSLEFSENNVFIEYSAESCMLSADKQCLVYFQFFNWDELGSKRDIAYRWVRNALALELSANINDTNFFQKITEKEIDGLLSEHVTIYRDCAWTRKSGCDEVFVCRLPYRDKICYLDPWSKEHRFVRLETYPEVFMLAVYKEGRNPIPFTVFLTEEGKKNRDKYIGQIMQSMRF